MKIGVIGGGQLGRMLALAGRPLGMEFRFLEPSANPPVQGLGELVRSPYDDPEALARFSRGLDAVTYEFENVPVDALRELADRVPVFPPAEALHDAQDRLREKARFQAHGIATAPFAPVDSFSDLEAAVRTLGTPAVLKTRRMGYDGKGQAVLRSATDARGAWEAAGGQPLILEGFVRFERELSILAVRGRSGGEAFYPLIENHHRDGILRLSYAPAPDVSMELQNEAEEIAGRILRHLDYVGLLAIELFQTPVGLLANEMAPRVHNSGHWTQDGASCSQFENHVRAVAGLPMGATTSVGLSAMVNLVGRVPAVDRILEDPAAHLHLYDKTPRPGRKLGHVNLVAADRARLDASVARLEALMGIAAPHTAIAGR